MIIGGLGSPRGTIVAAFVIGISDGSFLFFSPTLAKIIATLFVAMVWRPDLRFVRTSEKLRHAQDRRPLLLHLAILAGLFALQFMLPTYHHTNFARIMVLACYAMGYNLLMGYVGLLSLGHAMLFVADCMARASARNIWALTHSRPL